MTIVDMIRDAIDRFEADHGERPIQVLLGRSQLRELKRFVEKFDGGPVPAQDRTGTLRFDDFEILAVDADLPSVGQSARRPAPGMSFAFVGIAPRMWRKALSSWNAYD